MAICQMHPLEHVRMGTCMVRRGRGSGFREAEGAQAPTPGAGCTRLPVPRVLRRGEAAWASLSGTGFDGQVSLRTRAAVRPQCSGGLTVSLSSRALRRLGREVCLPPRVLGMSGGEGPACPHFVKSTVTCSWYFHACSPFPSCLLGSRRWGPSEAGPTLAPGPPGLRGSVTTHLSAVAAVGEPGGPWLSRLLVSLPHTPARARWGQTD